MKFPLLRIRPRQTKAIRARAERPTRFWSSSSRAFEMSSSTKRKPGTKSETKSSVSSSRPKSSSKLVVPVQPLSLWCKTSGKIGGKRSRLGCSERWRSQILTM